MNFLNQVKSSIYGPDFYSDLKNKPIGKSFRYYFELASIIALFTTIAFSIFVVPKVNSFLNNFGDTVVSSFPADLEVRLMDGKVSTNVVEPYIVPVPESWENNGELPDFENMVVIDTKESFNLDKFREYNTFALITEDSFVYENESGRISIQSLSSVPNVTINRTTITNWTEKTQPLARVIPFLLPILGFIAILIAYVFNLIYVAIVAVLVMLILRLKKMETSYKHAYHISLHAITLPIILSFFSSTSGINSFSFFPTIVFIVIVLINFKEKPQLVVSE